MTAVCCVAISTSLRAKRSNPLSPRARKDGLLRFARNDLARLRRTDVVLKVLTYISGSRYSLPGNDKGGRNADRCRQGVGACHALGAQFREGRESSERGDADAALRH